MAKTRWNWETIRVVIFLAAITTWIYGGMAAWLNRPAATIWWLFTSAMLWVAWGDLAKVKYGAKKEEVE